MPVVIAAPAERLQQMPTQYHWAVADSGMLQSIAEGVPVQRGRAGARLKMLVKLFARLRLTNLLLFTVGAFELAKLLLRQSRKADLNGKIRLVLAESPYPTTFFVGFGAGAEESLFTGYMARKGLPVARVDQTKVESMGQWHRVGVLQALASLMHSHTLARQAIASLPEEYGPWKVDFQTYVGMQLGYFSFVNAWFAKLKENAPGLIEVCFLSPDTAAFAAINIGLPTCFLQHGLIRHSLVLPMFDQVDALTHDEITHIRRRLPTANIRLARPVMTSIARRNPRCILVASVYGHHEELRRIIPVIEYMSELGLTIYMRPHPREDREFWQSGNLPFVVKLEDSDTSFDAALERLRPSLVVSWFSTALVDALYRGIIPVSVSAGDDPNVADMVYPLFSRCLQCPQDAGVLERLLDDDKYYDSVLSRLRDGLDEAWA